MARTGIIPLTAASVTAGSLLAPHTTSLLAAAVIALIGVILLTMLLGVILPGVWSRKPTRRQAAQTVLDQLLRPLRPPNCSHRRHRGPNR